VAAEVGDGDRAAADGAVGELEAAVGVGGVDGELVEEVGEVLFDGCVGDALTNPQRRRESPAKTMRAHRLMNRAT
jgi:hypothetical protein